MPIHRQIQLQHPHLGAIEVDRNLAAMLQLIWQFNIETFLSCERQTGDWIWIAFATSFDAERFLTLVANHLDENPAKRPRNSVYLRMAFSQWPDSWRYDMPVIDIAQEAPEETLPTAPANFCVSVSVRFPCSHHGKVLRALRAAVVARDAAAGCQQAAG